MFKNDSKSLDGLLLWYAFNSISYIKKETFKAKLRRKLLEINELQQLCEKGKKIDDLDVKAL